MRSALTRAWICSALVLLAGCQPEVRVVRDDWDSFRKFANAANSKWGTEQKSQGTAGRPKRPTFGIILGSFEGNGRDSRAEKFAVTVKAETQIPNVAVFKGESKTVVYRGPYIDSFTDDAQREFRQTKALEVNGKRAFPDAALMPLDAATRDASSLSAEIAQFELNQFAGFYTLQIGYYDKNYGSDYRKAAEQAVLSLRAEGEEAYFHHFPQQSTITIGIFEDRDVIRNTTQGEDGTMRVSYSYSARVRELQNRFPNHLANGMTIIDRGSGQDGVNQRTMLVRIRAD